MRREKLVTLSRIRPNVDDVNVAVGKPKDAVLVRFLASTRRSKLIVSVNRNFFESDMSV